MECQFKNHHECCINFTYTEWDLNLLVFCTLTADKRKVINNVTIEPQEPEDGGFSTMEMSTNRRSIHIRNGTLGRGSTLPRLVLICCLKFVPVYFIPTSGAISLEKKCCLYFMVLMHIFFFKNLSLLELSLSQK